MRRTKSCLALAGLQLCVVGVIAASFPRCSQPMSDPDESNAAPSISSLAATPAAIGVGGAATITGVLRDANGDTLSWTLALDASSTAAGTFSPASGPGNIAATFTATRAGTAIVRATASDGRGGTTAQTVTVTVGGGTAPTAVVR